MWSHSHSLGVPRRAGLQSFLSVTGNTCALTSPGAPLGPDSRFLTLACLRLQAHWLAHSCDRPAWRRHTHRHTHTPLSLDGNTHTHSLTRSPCLEATHLHTHTHTHTHPSPEAAGFPLSKGVSSLKHSRSDQSHFIFQPVLAELP